MSAHVAFWLDARLRWVRRSPPSFTRFVSSLQLFSVFLHFSSPSLLSICVPATMSEGERPTFDIAVPAKDPEPKEDDKSKHASDKGKARDDGKDEGPEMVRSDVSNRVEETQIVNWTFIERGRPAAQG